MTLPLVTEEIYHAFKLAIETGKWPTGIALTQAQRETCMAAIITYEAEHLAETARTGYIDKGHKDGDVCDDDAQIIKFK